MAQTKCPTCDGSGDCRECDGKRKTKSGKRCAECAGDGMCSKCNGTGKHE